MIDYGCKVCRVLDERELDHLDAELVARWHGEDGERMGYRRLADWLNTALLRTEMEIVGMPTEAGEARSRYERLTDDDRGGEMRELLRRGGVAVDDLLDDFVSYSVVRTHLTDCLGEERDPEPAGAWEAERLEQIETYAAEQAEGPIRSLVNKGELVAGGAIEPTVSVSLTCTDCGAAVPLADALEAGRICECS